MSAHKRSGMEDANSSTLEGSNDSTIILDSSSEHGATTPDKRREFKPVKPGGKLLHDDTIEISDGEEEEAEDDDDKDDGEKDDDDASLTTTTTVSQDSRYLTSVQSPGQFSFHTPGLHSSAILDRDSPRTSSSRREGDPGTSSADNIQASSVTVIQNKSSPGCVQQDPFEVEDEFCREGIDDDDNKEAVQEEEGRDSGLSATSPDTPTEHKLQDSSVASKRSREEPEEEGVSRTHSHNSSAVVDARGRGGGRQEEKEEEEGAHFSPPRPPSEAPLFKKRRIFEESDLPTTCAVLRTPRGVVYLVGTAHFSKESNEDVAQVVRLTQPDAVLLELCPGRTDILRLDEETLAREGQEMTTAKMIHTIRSYGTVQGTMYLLMLSMSAKLTRELGMAPGGEFRAAYKEAAQVPGCQVHLADRPIHITMKRALASLSLWQKIKLAFNVLTSTDSITKEEVEKCKNKDLLEGMLEELAGEYPAMTRVFVEERDIYLSYTLHAAAEAAPVTIPGSHRHSYAIPDRQRVVPGAGGDTDGGGQHQTARRVVVGVVGIGHVKGIKEQWGKVRPEDARRVIVVPKPSRMSVALRYAVRASFYSALLFGAYRLAAGRIGGSGWVGAWIPFPRKAG